jgi:transposase
MWRMFIMFMPLSHIKNEANRTHTVKYLNVSRRMVNECIKRFNDEGFDGLKEKPRSQRPSALSSQ